LENWTDRCGGQGTNIPGKKKEALNYSGGLPLYIQTIGEVADKGWEGFELSGGGYEQPARPAQAKTQPQTQTTADSAIKSAIEHVEDVMVPQISA
jgi:hypothetical protein